jgi:outer membrane protein TolC
MNYRLKAISLIFALFLPLQILSASESSVKEDPQSERLVTIPQGIQMVLKDSRLIKVALPENNISFEDSLISRAALLPHFSAVVNKTYNQYEPQERFGSQSFAIADKDPLSYSFEAYQTLFDFGKSLSNFRASRDLWAATKANTEAVRRMAVLEFVSAYFDLLEYDKMILVFEKEVESLVSYVNDIQHLYEQGSVVKNDLLPAKVRLADAKQRLIAARNAREIKAARLNNILALPIRERIKVEDIEMVSVHFPQIEVAWNTGQTQRPEVAFLENQIMASGQREKARAVENLPEIFADGNYSYTQNKFLVNKINTQVNLGAKFNLFDGGASTAQLFKERSRQRQLKEQKDKLLEDIKLEIEDSYFSLKNACEKVLVAREALGQADENVRFFRVKYNAGSATTTDVLEAISLQTKAEVNYYSDEYELKRNYTRLMYSMGIDLGLIYAKMEREEK